MIYLGSIQCFTGVIGISVRHADIVISKHKQDILKFQCDETFSLPQNGNIKLYQELKCPLDDFELLYLTSGVKGKGYVFCPYCYNNPPFRDMRKGNGCNSCTHPTCLHGQYSLGVSTCVECEEGILVSLVCSALLTNQNLRFALLPLCSSILNDFEKYLPYCTIGYVFVKKWIPASFSFILYQILLQFNVKMSIQYTAPGFEHTIFWLSVSSLNH